jgi:hypothetical protein
MHLLLYNVHKIYFFLFVICIQINETIKCLNQLSDVQRNGDDTNVAMYFLNNI